MRSKNISRHLLRFNNLFCFFDKYFRFLLFSSSPNLDSIYERYASFFTVKANAEYADIQL